MLIKTMLIFQKLFRVILVFSKINVIGLPSKGWAVLHPKFYADYEYKDHSQNIFTNFEYTVSVRKNSIYTADSVS